MSEPTVPRSICTCCTPALFNMKRVVAARLDLCCLFPRCVCASLTATIVYNVVARKEIEFRRSPPSVGCVVFLLRSGGYDGGSHLRQDGLEVHEGPTARPPVERPGGGKIPLLAPWDLHRGTGSQMQEQILCCWIEIDSPGSFYLSVSFNICTKTSVLCSFFIGQTS